LLLVLLGAWSWQVYDLGRRHGGYDSNLVEHRRGELKGRLETLEDERETLRLRAASMERSAQIDRDAVRRAREEIRALQDEGSALKQEVTFLRGLLSQGQGALYVKDFRLSAGTSPGRFGYAFTVTQVLKNVGTTEGEIELKVAGTRDGKRQTLELKALTGGKTSRIKLRFMHYQEVQGTLELPQSFKPESVTLELRPKNRKLSRVTRVFDWKLEESS